jgi:formamidopyrimidine-DNA glycosylase
MRFYRRQHRIIMHPRRFGMMDYSETKRTAQAPRISASSRRQFNTDFLARICRQEAAESRSARSKHRRWPRQYYVCEALHRARLSPKRKPETVKRANRSPLDLWCDGSRCLNEAIEAADRSLRDYAGTDGVNGAFRVFRLRPQGTLFRMDAVARSGALSNRGDRLSIAQPASAEISRPSNISS